ncbi:MAG: response regulator [Candidatus Paceibacterota bacterium]|jgi:CheY-like chemotaxis protein
MNRILIAEDDVFVSRMYGRVFRAAGFEVETVPDGEVALARLAQDPLPSIILMDIMMPKMGGFELLERIKKDPRLTRLPVVVLTNSFVADDEKRFLGLGADLYLIKIENSAKDVVRKIENLIHRKNANN